MQSRRLTEPQRATQRAIALVSVLWVLMLLSLIVVNISATSRIELKRSANLVEAARVRQVTDAAVNWALWSLMQPNTANWLADGSWRLLELDEVQVQVAITDEHGKIDLNNANPLLLQGLFEAVGIEGVEAQALSDAIQDWRDTDLLKRLYGAENEEYKAAGLSGPADRPFERLEELKQVLGMTPELYEKVRPALTLNSNHGGINPLVASRLALMALPGVSEAAAEQYIKERRRSYEQGMTPPTFTGVLPQLLTSNVPGVGYAIDTVVHKANRVVSRQRIVIRRRGGMGTRFEILTIASLREAPEELQISEGQGDSL